MAKKTSLEAIIASNAAQAIETVKGATNATKSTTSKKAASTKEEKPTAKKPLKKVTPATPTKETKEVAKVTKEVAKAQKISIIEEVTSHREVKYIYPEDCTDTLARKKWRQQTRNELHRLEREMHRIQDTTSKEYKAAVKAFNEFKATVLKPEQVA